MGNTYFIKSIKMKIFSYSALVVALFVSD